MYYNSNKGLAGVCCLLYSGCVSNNGHGLPHAPWHTVCTPFPPKIGQVNRFGCSMKDLPTRATMIQVSSLHGHVPSSVFDCPRDSSSTEGASGQRHVTLRSTRLDVSKQIRAGTGGRQRQSGGGRGGRGRGRTRDDRERHANACIHKNKHKEMMRGVGAGIESERDGEQWQSQRQRLEGRPCHRSD